MVSEVFYKYFIVLKRSLPNTKFIISGDFEQLLPVKDRIGYCDYKNSPAIAELADYNRIQLQKCRRADDSLFKMLDPKTIHTLKKEDFNGRFTKRHISWTNDKRKKINKSMMEQHIEEIKNICKQKKQKVPDTIEFKKISTIENSQNVILCEEMPIIARKNIPRLDIANNEQFIIKRIELDDELIIIENECTKELNEINFEDFQSWFYVAFCITCHKVQGASYDFEYTIHEFDRFDSRLRYVALSRATKKEFINIV